MYKSMLHNLCQQRKWQAPFYRNFKEGSEHNPSFRSMVVINGLPFYSPSFSGSRKQAQNDAAKVAYEHFMLQAAPVPTPSSSPFHFRAGEAAAAPSTSTAPGPPPETVTTLLAATNQLLGSLLASQEQANRVIIGYLRHIYQKFDDPAPGESDAGESEEGESEDER